MFLLKNVIKIAFRPLIFLMGSTHFFYILDAQPAQVVEW